jgi:hypothetical protein
MHSTTRVTKNIFAKNIELELIQTQTAQKQMLREVEYARALPASQNEERYTHQIG